MANLAAQLRQLREKAGRPSYRQLACRAYYSHSTLSQAAAGRELPSLAVTLAFAEACGGDRREWAARWREAAEAVGVAAPMAAVPDRESVTRRSRLAWTRWHRLAAVGLVAGIASAAIWSAGLSYGRMTVTATARAARQSVGRLVPPVAGDADPAADCGGVRNLVSSSVRSGDGADLGTVQLLYSVRCSAVWTWFVPSPALQRAEAVMITLKAIRRPDGVTAVSSAPYTGYLQHSELIPLRAGCAEASIRITEMGRPVATETTSCQAPPG